MAEKMSDTGRPLKPAPAHKRKARIFSGLDLDNVVEFQEVQYRDEAGQNHSKRIASRARPNVMYDMTYHPIDDFMRSNKRTKPIVKDKTDDRPPNKKRKKTAPNMSKGMTKENAQQQGPSTRKIAESISSDDLVTQISQRHSSPGLDDISFVTAEEIPEIESTQKSPSVVTKLKSLPGDALPGTFPASQTGDEPDARSESNAGQDALPIAATPHSLRSQLCELTREALSREQFEQRIVETVRRWPQDSNEHELANSQRGDGQRSWTGVSPIATAQPPQDMERHTPVSYYHSNVGQPRPCSEASSRTVSAAPSPSDLAPDILRGS